MTTKETILAFITTSVGLRYWYLSRRKGRYNVAKAKFKDYANVYGEMYALILKDKDSVFAALKELRNDKLPANTLAYVQDFTVLLETVTFFSETSSQVAPPSIFEELFAFIKDVVEVAGVADINEYLKKNDLKITQNFADLCAFNGIKVDSSFIQVPLPPPVIFPGGSPLNLPFGGGNATLSWTTQHATSVTIDNGVGPVPVNGSKTVNVTTSTTFTLTASNAAGTAQSQVSVVVATAAPIWIGIQSWWNQQMTPHENYSSQLFSLPYVIPYIEAFFSFGDGDARSMRERAEHVRDRVVETRDLLRQYHPNVPFNWGYWPHRYAGDGFTGPDDKLFAHKDDRLGGYNTVFTAHGRELFRAKTREFFGYLKPMLVAAGIPDPIFLDADYEGGGGSPIVGPGWMDSRATWHNIIMSDPRATTELIDGVQTYAQFTSNLRDMSGNPYPASELYPYIYDGSEFGYQRCNIYSSLNNMVVDYGLWYSLYQPAQEVWPNVICGNWQTTASSRSKLVNGWRFKEAAIDAGPNFHGMQICAMYGNATMDQAFWNVGLGMNTFKEQLFRFGINPADYPDKDALARKINSSLVEYMTAGMNEANPAGKKGISLTWCGEGSWYGATAFTDPNFFPPEYIGAKLDYKAHPEIFDEIFASCRRNNVSVIEIFAENTRKSACDDMYTAFRRLR